MLRRIFAFFVFASMLLAASACGSVETGGKSGGKAVSGEIQFYTYRDDLLNTWYPKALEEFKAKYPDVKVVTSTSKDSENDLKVKMSANDVPDVMTLQGGDIYSDKQKETYLLALDEVFPDLVKNWQGNDSFVSANDKKTYALTFGLQSVGLAYNKNIFTELGLQPPKTLDELIAAGKKIKESGRIGLAGCLKPVWTTEPYLYLSRIFMDSMTDTYNKMATEDAPFTLDGPYGKAMSVFKKIADAGIWEEDALSYDWEPFLKDFGSGKIGMTFIWTNTPVQFPDRGDGSFKLEDIGFVPFPYDNSGGPYKTLYFADHGMAVSKSSKNLEAARAFFKWHMDDKYADYALANASISANKNVTVDVPYLKEFNSAGPVMVFDEKVPAEFKTIMDKAQLDICQQLVEIAAGNDVNTQIEKMNAAWKNGRASR